MGKDKAHVQSSGEDASREQAFLEGLGLPLGLPPVGVDTQLMSELTFPTAFSRILNREFYTYQGSQTHPPCKENIKWIVAAEPVAIDNQWLTGEGAGRQAFASLANSRPVQPL